ncbi:hypothetical protein [Chryseobacterium sp.]|uniref:hypothetical protein n=1 Tax=Chryseobacterium sp. TaxID=1871047 RepID=UPI000ED93643|nr:hypothetical protein [Chryseobacterium sp.]HCA06603.1 hypothetical protein [Chryseobacterium sp.]
MKNLFLLFILIISITSCRNDNDLSEDNSKNSTIELKTINPNFISQIQVDYEGAIVNTNNQNILSYGMLIGENENLTVDSNLGNQSKSYSIGDATYKGSFFDLVGNKKYFLRFYVKTENKTYYGNIVSFETKTHIKPTEQYIKLNTQQQVEDFGQHNYTYVFNLEISGSVEDLSPLSSIVKIGNSLQIQYTNKLKNLHGLDNLQLVGTDVLPNGHLQIYNNSKLESLSGLDNVIFTGRLYVGDNPLVQNLYGLGKLEQAWHSTYLTVPSFDGLPLNFKTGEFTSIGFQESSLGARKINCEAYDFTIKDAPNIISLKGFTVGNYQNTTSFTIENCKSLKSLEEIVFPNIYDDISIVNCENLESLKGIENLTKIDNLFLRNLPKLKKIEVLVNLIEIGHLGLDNVGLENFIGLNNVKSMDAFTITSCNNLINFNGLSSLKRIGDGIRYFEVSNCQNLQNFVGLENVVNFTRFNINNLPKLNNFVGVGNAKMLYTSISNCNLINSLQGLENVLSIGNVAIYQNQNLQNFCSIKNIVGNINSYYVTGNLLNPTKQEVISNCP